MKKTLLIPVSSERETRTLLRGNFFNRLKEKFNIIIASTAENSKQWKESFQDVSFFSDIIGNTVSEKLKRIKVDVVVSCGNTDTPVHQFDVLVHTEAKKLGIPFIYIQDFIDMIFHPFVNEPDLILVWGNWFKKIIMNERSVLVWNHKNGGCTNFATVNPVDNSKIKICGPLHFDDYVNYPIPSRQILCDELKLDSNKLIFTYTPNGDLAEWVFWTFDNFMQMAEKFNAQVILKAHPIRHNDSYLFKFVANKYPQVPFRIVHNWSFIKGLAINMPGYANGEFLFDYRDSLQLAGILKNSDIIGSSGSTAGMESMIFNVPSIWDMTNWTHCFEFRVQMTRWEFEIINNYRCCEIILQQQDLQSAFERNLQNPLLLEEGRKNIINDWFNNVDGMAGYRAVQYIEEFLDANS